jgi:hypothetical protein
VILFVFAFQLELSDCPAAAVPPAGLFLNEVNASQCFASAGHRAQDLGFGEIPKAREGHVMVEAGGTAASETSHQVMCCSLSNVMIPGNYTFFSEMFLRK